MLACVLVHHLAAWVTVSMAYRQALLPALFGTDPYHGLALYQQKTKTKKQIKQQKQKIIIKT